MSAAAVRMERPEAVAIARRFVELLDGTYDQLIVAGSLRRRLAHIGDIEIVAVPRIGIVRRETVGLFGSELSTYEVDELDARLLHLLAAGMVERRLDVNGVPRLGPTLKYLTFEGARVDLFTPCAERLGWILALRTGPYRFSKQLVVPKGKRTNDGRPGLMPAHIKPDTGWLTFRTSGERIETPTEQSVFELFKIPYAEPWERL